MKRGRIGGPLADQTFFLRASPDDTADLLHAFGFKPVYDRNNDQFAHLAPLSRSRRRAASDRSPTISG